MDEYEEAQEAMKKITNVKDAIRLYALCVSKEIADPGSFKRIAIHDRLCELLGVNKHDFKPFDGLWVRMDCEWRHEMCELLIKDEIRRLKKNE